MIHQILISEQIDPKEDIILEENKRKFQQIYPDEQYLLWRDSDIRSILDKQSLESYNTLKAYASKADLAKHVILSKFGGWYYDIHTFPLINMDVKDYDMVIFRDIQRNSGTSFSVACNVIYSVPNSEISNLVIHMINENVKNRYYGITPLCPTGPTVFGKAIANFGGNKRILVGDYLELTPLAKIKNRANVLPNGNILDFGKKLPGGNLDISGTNNYNDLWHNGTFYGETRRIKPCLTYMVKRRLKGLKKAVEDF